MTTSARQALSFVFLVLFPIIEAASYAHLYWKRNDILVQKRSKSLIFVASFAGWLSYFNLVVSMFSGIPCGVFWVASLLIAPLSIGPQLLRALHLRGTIKSTLLSVEEEISSRAQRKKAGQLPTIPGSDVSENGEELSSPQSMTKLMEANLMMEQTRRIANMTGWALLVVPTLLIILALVLTESHLLALQNFDQCLPEPTFFLYTFLAFGIASAALALIVAMLVYKIEDDEIGLRREIQRNATLLGVTQIMIIVVKFTGHFDWQPLLQLIQQIMLICSTAIVPFIPSSGLSGMASWARQRISPGTKSAVPGYAQTLPGSNAAHRTTRASVSVQQFLGRGTSVATDQRNREVTVSWDAGLCILLSTEEGELTFFANI